MKYLFRGGTVVSGRGTRRADILVEGEKILEVGRNITRKADQIIDVTGMLLMPGFIDAHTHFDLDVCNTTTADNFTTGSRAALRGGTTTVVDFACPNKGESLHHGLELWHRKADGRTCCDYGFHMTIDDWNDGIRAELPQMFDEGISSFKMYMTYPAMMIGDEAMFHALREMKRLGGIVGVHCENAGMIDALIAEKKAAGALSPASHPLCRPAEAEAEAVGRLLKLARVADVPVMIVHLSTAAALREVEAARGLGQKVFVETCPHYLLLDDSRYSLPDFAGARYVCAPPLRKKLDNERLWKALADPAYFQGNVDYYIKNRGQTTVTDDDGNTIEFNPVQGDPYDQTTTIKRSDGSVLYDVAFRTQTADQVRTLAAEACMSSNSVHMECFDEMSTTQIQAFESFMDYAREQGTTVILVLSPWHPYLYGYLITEPELHKGFFQVENWLREYCAKNNVPLYGSYDPECIDGLEETDFFDGLHCAGTGIARFFPGIPQALQQLETGTLPDPLAVHPRTSLESADPDVVETLNGETAETAQEG